MSYSDTQKYQIRLEIDEYPPQDAIEKREEKYVRHQISEKTDIPIDNVDVNLEVTNKREVEMEDELEELGQVTYHTQVFTVEIHAKSKDTQIEYVNPDDIRKIIEERVSDDYHIDESTVSDSSQTA